VRSLIRTTPPHSSSTRLAITKDSALIDILPNRCWAVQVKERHPTGSSNLLEELTTLHGHSLQQNQAPGEQDFAGRARFLNVGTQ
jgi:hypothetical protein